MNSRSSVKDNPWVEALKVVALLGGLWIVLMIASYFLVDDANARPFVGAVMVYGAIGVGIGWIPAFIFLMNAIFGKYDKLANLFRAAVFVLYIAVSYYFSPFATNYGEITRPILQCHAYVLLHIYMVWQLGREKPWKPHMSLK